MTSIPRVTVGWGRRVPVRPVSLPQGPEKELSYRIPSSTLSVFSSGALDVQRENVFILLTTSKSFTSVKNKLKEIKFC